MRVIMPVIIAVFALTTSFTLRSSTSKSRRSGSTEFR
jgi:hypothetical protein